MRLINCQTIVARKDRCECEQIDPGSAQPSSRLGGHGAPPLLMILE